ncbi:MAG TPA: DNA cytosine methyltransferase [Acidimicrobiales bacterium]|nr:DNA cytosine methyltransferase [Acidimicrobiales bacterium]
MPTVVDLFAGCGGLTQGFVSARRGFRPIAAVEWDLAAASTYAANFGEHHVANVDIAAFTDVPRADVVIGGPPCQGFSNLGTKDPDDPRNSLWREYLRVVLEANPQVFVLENVERFSRTSEFELLMRELTDGRLRRWKWHVAGVLNAADFGVPQRRHRTIVIASRVGPVTLPVATHGKGTRPWLTVRDAIAGLPARPGTTTLPHSTVDVLGARVPGVFKMSDLHIGRSPKPLSLERYDHIPPGGGRFDLPEHLLPRCWATKATGTTDVMGRMRWDAPSLTIRTEFFKPEKGQYLHPEWDERDPSKRVNRPITHQEAALLQTFPSDFLWCGTKIEIARQIGNAVPPQLAQSLAHVVADRLR